MSWDYISLGNTPYGEDCVQVGSENYLQKATVEANVMIKLMERVHPIPNSLKGFVKYDMKYNHHDYGMYLDVIVKYIDILQEASDFALQAESIVPEFWDDTAKEQLIESGYLKY